MPRIRMYCTRFALILGVVILMSPARDAHADRFTRFTFDKYVGGGVWSVAYTPDSGPDYSMAGVMLKAGYELSRTLAVEAHVGTTETDTQSVFGGTTPVDVRITGLGGIFAKLSWLREEARGWARIYALIGLSSVTVHAEGQGTSADDSETSASFGVGIDLFGSDRTAIMFEWVRYITKSDFTIDAPIVGIVHRF